jgi:hypothetical protein
MIKYKQLIKSFGFFKLSIFDIIYTPVACIKKIISCG